MSTDLVAERLSLLVGRTGMPGEELVALIGLPSSVMPDEILSGDRRLSPSEIVAAADALDVPVTLLTGDLPVDGHLGVSLRLGVFADAVDAPTEALELADLMMDRHATLDLLLGPAAVAPRVPVSTDRYALNAGRATADRVRRALQLGREPVADLVGLVESFGFPVLFHELPEGLHGVNVRDERNGRPLRLIVISTRGGWPMQRYTLAHELCHALYDDEGQVILDHLEEPVALEEIRAEAFARELLVPRQALAEDLRRMGVSLASSPEEWARAVPAMMIKWGASRRALVRSLINDGHASDESLRVVGRSRVRDLVEGYYLA